MERVDSQLVRGIETTSPNERVREECLEVMKDLLNRFGVNGHQHEGVMGLILTTFDGMSICKRATACIGSLAVVLADSF